MERRIGPLAEASNPGDLRPRAKAFESIIGAGTLGAAVAVVGGGGGGSAGPVAAGGAPAVSAWGIDMERVLENQRWKHALQHRMQ
jgi:hypothetical protein